VYTDLHATIGRTEPDKDLKFWSATHGVDMPMAWPQFEVRFFSLLSVDNLYDFYDKRFDLMFLLKSLVL
jgi:hypothetical protein